MSAPSPTHLSGLVTARACPRSRARGGLPLACAASGSGSQNWWNHRFGACLEKKPPSRLGKGGVRPGSMVSTASS